MKNMIWSFLFFFMLLGCNDDDNTNQEEQEPVQESSIYGTWRLVGVRGLVPERSPNEVSLSIIPRRTVPDGYIIEFYEDLRFSSICSESEDGEEFNYGIPWGPCLDSNGKNMDGSYTIAMRDSTKYSQRDTITLIFDEILDGFNEEFARKRILKFYFEGQYLFLQPIPLCDGGCSDEFERVQVAKEE